jgi:hypothetical protein
MGASSPRRSTARRCAREFDDGSGAGEAKSETEARRSGGGRETAQESWVVRFWRRRGRENCAEPFGEDAQWRALPDARARLGSDGGGAPRAACAQRTPAEPRARDMGWGAALRLARSLGRQARACWAASAGAGLGCGHARGGAGLAGRGAGPRGGGRRLARRCELGRDAVGRAGGGGGEGRGGRGAAGPAELGQGGDWATFPFPFFFLFSFSFLFISV